MNYVIKRDGRNVPFREEKIKEAISKAIKDVSQKDIILSNVLEKVLLFIKDQKEETISVEEIQDIVETVLMSNYPEIAKSYILYREERTKERLRKSGFAKKVTSILKKTSRENANVGNCTSAKLLQVGEETIRDFSLNNLISDKVRENIQNGYIYPHDFSWYALGTTTCLQIPLEKLFKEGFNTGHGFIRPPKRVQSAADLTCIVIQANQNEQHGGQSIPGFDKAIGAIIENEYEELLKEKIENHTAMCKALNIPIFKECSERIIAQAKEETLKQIRKNTAQAMESLVFNLNTMHARSGAQVPFSSISIGTGVSFGERLVTEMLLKAYQKGLGKHEQPLFPNILFKLKKGVNMYPEDINYDLFCLACEVSSMRLSPTFVFEDSSFNKGLDEEVEYMGCRTRVATDTFGKSSPLGRGNLSFTTLNLVAMAIESKHNIDEFFKMLEEKIDIAIEQLLARYHYQCSFKVKDFPFLMGQGLWKGSEKLNPEDTLESVLKHGTLTIGFIGLAETLKSLIGEHHGESIKAQELGLKIVSYIRKRTDEATEKYHLNFSLIATPAEGLTGKLLLKNREKYGVIPGVTDKEWLTNSFHIPVEYPISMFDKIEIEGAYHKYCNGGHISYVELDSSPANNIQAFMHIIYAMAKADMGYAAINFPVDICRQCGYIGYIENDCPCCGNASLNIQRIRRITGYLAEINMFNHAKKEETHNRVKHNKIQRIR